MARRNKGGYTPIPPVATGMYTKFTGGGGPRPDELWGAVDGNILRAFLEAVTTRGDAVSFARTSDGGAMALNIMSGDDRLKLYSRDPEEMNITMQDTADELARGGETVSER